MESEILYDCVICGQSGPSTEDRPTGLVVLLQASSVLGHRCKSTEPKNLPTSDEEHVYPADTCGAANDVRLTLMQRFFKDSSCLQSVSIGWDGGVYVQTCGHTLHIDCHKSYMESLRVRISLTSWNNCLLYCFVGQLCQLINHSDHYSCLNIKSLCFLFV